MTSVDPAGEFADAMRERGIILPGRPIADGNLHRCSAAGRHGKGDAAYVLHLDGLAAGGFINWRDGLGWQNWHEKITRKLTAAERAAHKRRKAHVRAQHDAEEQRRHAGAADEARGTWRDAGSECNGHAYLTAKHLGDAHGARLSGDGRLVVPVHDNLDGEIISVQFIAGNGTKLFLKGGRVRGGSFVIGDITSADTIIIGEGFATAATLHEATAFPVIAAFNSGNLSPVAAVARQRFPKAKIVIAADDDHTRNNNPGITKAKEAAALVAGVVAIPDFGPNRPPGFKDFNDLGFFAGYDRVRELIDQTVEALKTNGAAGDEAEVSDADAEAEITRLAKLSPVRYARERDASAKRLKMPLGMLDRLVKLERQGDGNDRLQGRPVEFPALEPWPGSVDGAELLVDLTSYFADHLHAPPRAPATFALWTLHTYCFRLFRHTGRLNIRSVVKRSGKSTALDLLQMVVAKPLRSENISVAAIFRVVDFAAPALLIDEADGFLRDNAELISLLNAGYARGGQAVRCIGDDAEPRAFSVFAPAAIAGIGALPGTLADRAIVVPLQRAKRDEQKKQIDAATEAKAAELSRRAARWATDNAAALANAAPDMGQMFARAAQIWRPLYAIAQLAGGNWPDLVGKASEALAADDDDAEALGVKLLADVRTTFAASEAKKAHEKALAEAKATGKTDAEAEALAELAARDAVHAVNWKNEKRELPTEQIVQALNEMEDRPWPEMPSRRGPPKALTTAGFTRMVKTFGPRRQNLVLGSNQRAWGYRAADFIEAWNRYLDA